MYSFPCGFTIRVVRMIVIYVPTGVIIHVRMVVIYVPTGFYMDNSKSH